MASSLIEPRSRGANLNRLTAPQRVFCEEMAADPQMNPTKAAEKAGYKKPVQAGHRLLKNKVVRSYLGKVLQQRLERCRLTADDVLEHLRTALFLDPAELFEIGEQGGVKIKDLLDIPLEIRRCITKLKATVYESEDGSTTTKLEVETMGKDSAMLNTLKHLGIMVPDGATVNINQGKFIDFDKLCGPSDENDVVEGKIEER